MENDAQDDFDLPKEANVFEVPDSEDAYSDDPDNI